MIIKCGRREFNVDHTDAILDNGACYILITQTYFKDWSNINPIVSKSLFKKLLKEEKIYKARQYGKYDDMWIYKFTGE